MSDSSGLRITKNVETKEIKEEGKKSGKIEAERRSLNFFTS